MRRHQLDNDAAGSKPRMRRPQTADAQTATSREAMGTESTDDSDAFNGHILERVQTLLNESLHAAETDAVAEEQKGYDATPLLIRLVTDI